MLHATFAVLLDHHDVPMLSCTVKIEFIVYTYQWLHAESCRDSLHMPPYGGILKLCAHFG